MPAKKKSKSKVDEAALTKAFAQGVAEARTPVMYRIDVFDGEIQLSTLVRAVEDVAEEVGTLLTQFGGRDFGINIKAIEVGEQGSDDDVVDAEIVG